MSACSAPAAPRSRRLRSRPPRRLAQRRKPRPRRKPPAAPRPRSAPPSATRRFPRSGRIASAAASRIASATTKTPACADCVSAHACSRCGMSGDSTLFHLHLSRRGLLAAALALSAAPAFARTAAFDRWGAGFRPRALARGISEATYDRVMSSLTPDTSVYEAVRAQPEFTEQMWQYINRRCSDWRVITGKERAKEYASVLHRVEAEYGVDRYALLGRGGMESSFGDVIANPKYMRPIIPALAALAYGEPRRRRNWEDELLFVLLFFVRGWAQPKEKIGFWVGALGFL